VALLACCAVCILVLTVVLVSFARISSSVSGANRTDAVERVVARWQRADIDAATARQRAPENSRALELAGVGNRVARQQCPKLGGDGGRRAVAMSVVELKPRPGSRIPAAMDVATAKMVCSFESRSSGPMPSRVVAVVPRTACTDVECACHEATRDGWAVISTRGEGTVQLAAAFSVAEDPSTGDAMPVFELATVLTESSASMETNKLLPETERSAIPVSCKLIWSDDLHER
jgi:hypothetical protein